jgi:hypothetical protein
LSALFWHLRCPFKTTPFENSSSGSTIRPLWSAKIPSGGFQRNVTLLHSDRLPSEALCCGKIPSYFEALTCPWRITELGQNHDAQRYCAPPPRIGQPLMLAWQDLWVRNAFERELLVERFPDVELH